MILPHDATPKPDRIFGRDKGQNIAFEFRSAEGKLDRLPWSLMPGLDREHRKQEKRHAG
jgi:hypothetical protein